MSTKKRKHVDLKSQVCFAESIFEALVLDVASGRSSKLRSSLLRDLDTIKTRLCHEGIKFCTITLPSLSKAIYQSFRTGKLDCPTSFKRIKGTMLPRLFSGLLKEIYAEDGTLLEKADIASITEVLQLCGLGYKLDIPFTGDEESQVLQNFTQTEIEISQLGDFETSDPFVVSLAKSMIAGVFRDFDISKILPKHGPGAVATKERGYKKWNFSKQYAKLHKVFPHHDFYVCGRDHYYDQLDKWENLEKLDRGIAAVILVPKDSRGPRLISMEPLDFQFIQQGVRGAMEMAISTHPLTRRRVNFDDQTINRKLCKKGSQYGNWATLDMKDASDRISLKLVKSLFEGAPRLLEALLASRSDATRLPSDQVLELHKFAPMGSSTCFPVESICHFMLAVATISYNFRIPVWKAIRSVRVFGDDLIIRTPYAHHVMVALNHFGLRFNENKCFIHGPFRESCGIEAFKGINVAPVRWRKPWSRRLNAVSAQSFLDLASLFYQRGYCRAAEVVWKGLEVQLGCLPTTPLDLSVGYLTRKSRFPQIHTPYRYRKDPWVHDLLHYALEIHQPVYHQENNDWEDLLRFFLTGSAASTMSVDYSYTRSRWLRLQGTLPYEGVGKLVAVTAAATSKSLLKDRKTSSHVLGSTPTSDGKARKPRRVKSMS
jgi:hypothetical protein